MPMPSSTVIVLRTIHTVGCIDALLSLDFDDDRFNGFDAAKDQIPGVSDDLRDKVFSVHFTLWGVVGRLGSGLGLKPV